MNQFNISGNWEYHTLKDEIKLIDSFFKENINTKNVVFDFSNLNYY